MKTQAELDKVWDRYIEFRDDFEKGQLVEHYFLFVQKISVKLSEKLNWRVQPPELASFGVDGLYRAIERFDKNRNVKFESFASRRIRGSMIDGLRKEDLIPRSVRISYDKMNKHRQRLQNHFGRKVSEPEFVDLIGMEKSHSAKEYKKMVPVSFASLHGMAESNGENDFKEDMNPSLIDSRLSSVDAGLSRREFFSKLMGNNFSIVEKRIIYLYYYENMTMDKVAEKIFLSESRVSQMHRQIINRLKNKLDRNPEYFDNDVYEFIQSCKHKESIF